MKGLVLDRRSDTPLQRQVETAFREAILSGRLKAGERILSSRELQTHLGVSRNTIVGALSQLQAEGYLVTVRSKGTYVADVLHAPVKGEKSRVAPTPETGFLPTERGRRILSSSGLAANLRETAPFRPGIPALDLFPAAQLRRALKLDEWLAPTLDYPEVLGEKRLREAIVERLQQTRGVACSPDQVLVTGGAQAGFALIARVLAKRGDPVLVEEPGYPNARAAFLSEGATIVTAPVDDAGLCVASLGKGRAKLVYTTPSHQYPTGAVLSLERRLALLDWATRHEAWVIEDDYDSEFNYSGRPQPALHSLDDSHRVLYVGTFSKTLAPALRVAYLVVPMPLKPLFQAAHQVAGGQPSTLLQRALATFMESGLFGRHITRVRKIYGERRSLLTAEIARRGGDSLQVRDTLTGLHFIVTLPDAMNDRAISQRARESGLTVPALSAFFHGRPTMNGLVLGFAATAVAEARQAVTTLMQLIESA